jgi:hypothetical protein
MQCYHCGGSIPFRTRVCPTCGHARSRLIYVHLWGVIGGVAGSLIGWTVFDLAGAFLGGLLGIVVGELGAWLAFRPGPRNEAGAPTER